MHRIYYLNGILPEGLGEGYSTASSLEEAEAVVVRSASLHGMALPGGLLAVARAGAGVNNIPLEACAEKGIVVFNTPGANANSVVELTLCGMLLGCRDVAGGIEWVRSLSGDVAAQVEKGKARFGGREIAGKKLGVIGLGAVGGPLANAARKLGMEVYGFDPFISIDGAWHLDSRIVRVKTREEIYERCDIISLHVPLTADTERMIGPEALEAMKDGVVLLNFARDRLVDEDAVAEALASGKVGRYVTDFPNEKTAHLPGCVAIPHLGASTREAEENCAKMAASQVKNYLENGNLMNCVNFPDCDMGICAAAGRVTILHRNIPNSLGRFTAALAGAGVNIAGLMNRSRGVYAYTMLDLDSPVPAAVVEEMKRMEGTLRVRVVR